ncbi:hypothetical protein HAL_39740 [Haladaptatus sp. T7]|nr:hypothetical protein HAL_39740 [Haladaptatus sp. T7]
MAREVLLLPQKQKVCLPQKIAGQHHWELPGKHERHTLLDLLARISGHDGETVLPVTFLGIPILKVQLSQMASPILVSLKMSAQRMVQ